VAAAAVLGLDEDNVIFLGYPDTLLRNIYNAGSETQIFTGPSGRTSTYGFRGLGRVDYHTHLTGAAGDYNRKTMRQDFEALVTNYLRAEIHTVTPYDDHPDHQAVAMLVEDALTTLSQSGASPNTRLFQSIVWVPGGYPWPMLDGNGFTPTVPFQEPPNMVEPDAAALVRNLPLPGSPGNAFDGSGHEHEVPGHSPVPIAALQLAHVLRPR
jgi:LmbE family N-acetylglucosaminyl deacetylase